MKTTLLLIASIRFDVSLPNDPNDYNYSRRLEFDQESILFELDTDPDIADLLLWETNQHIMNLSRILDFLSTNGINLPYEFQALMRDKDCDYCNSYWYQGCRFFFRKKLRYVA